MEEPASLEHAYARLAWLVPHLPVQVFALHPPGESDRVLRVWISPLQSDARQRVERLLAAAAIAEVTDLQQTEGGWFAYAWSDAQRAEAAGQLSDTETTQLAELIQD